MGLSGFISPIVMEYVDFDVVATVGLAVLGGITVAPVVNLAPEPASQVMLTSLAFTVILACAVAIKIQVRLAVTQVFLFLDRTREELDAGRTEWITQRETNVESRDVDKIGTTGSEHHPSRFDRTSETKLCRSHILEQSTAPVTATPYHQLDQPTGRVTQDRVTYDSTPVITSIIQTSKRRALFGLTDSMDDCHVDKKARETPDETGCDGIPFEDEDDSFAAELAAEWEAMEPQEAAQDVECRVPKQVNHPSRAAFYAFLHIFRTIC